MHRVAQAVDVVEAQALQVAGGDQARHQRMNGAEGRRVFHAQAGEIVDVEEAPVVHRRHRHAPIGDAVMLALEQPVQGGGAGFVAAGDRRSSPRSISAAAPAIAASWRLSVRRLAVGGRARIAIIVGERKECAAGRASAAASAAATMVRSISP